MKSVKSSDPCESSNLYESLINPVKSSIREILKSVIVILAAAMPMRGNAQTENLWFERIGFDQGLANEIITSLLQDSKGYMWIGTVSGLFKYDGYSFKRYQFDPLDSNSLSQNYIYTIWEDPQSSIWVSTFEGLCKFDRFTEKFTRYKPDPNSSFSDPNISVINEDKNGTMWVGTWSGAMSRFDKQTGKFFPESLDLKFKKLQGKETTLHDGIACLYKDRRGDLWVGNVAGVHKLDIQQSKPGQPSKVKIKSYLNDPDNPNSLSGKMVFGIFEDHNGIIWVATENGLNSLDPATDNFKHYQHDPDDPNSISRGSSAPWWSGTISEDQQGNLWLATSSGLYKLNKNRTVFSVYTHDPSDNSSLSSESLTTLLIDRSGILWTGSWSGKLNKANLNRKSFGLSQNDKMNNNSLSNNEVTAIMEDSSGYVWIGTAGGGLNRWDRMTNQFKRYRADPKKPGLDFVYGILEDRHGHMWIAHLDILSKFDRLTGKFEHFDSNERNYELVDSRAILAITEDRDGIIWLGTGSGIKSFDEKTGRFKHYYHDKADTTGISDYTAISIFADSRDNIWVGFGSIATDRLEKKSRRIFHYRHNPQDPSSISSNIVNSFLEDSKGNLWLATSAGGLCQFNYETQKFTTYTDKNGLEDNEVCSILEDNNNHLWLGTTSGLSRFDPVTKMFVNYDYKDGLQDRVFAAGLRNRPARFKGRDGTLYFGGRKGFNFFHPDQIKPDTNLAPVVITQFKLFDNLVKGANELKEVILQHDENYFSFEFSSLSFRYPEKNQYAYKLDGVDKDWIYSGSRRYTGYTNISPGTYTFRVKATNSDGIWNEEGTSINLVILPPWWKTWWAYTFYALLLIASVRVVHLYQKQRVIQTERERAQAKELEQAKEIEKAYHELKTTQQQLIQSEKMASLGELTAGIAHEIQNPLNFVNNFSEVNKELLMELGEKIDKGKFDEVKAIAKDLIENEEKINHHGKRADTVVKGMLQHSRSGGGIKEPTDINELANEYLRLAYHGLRAKDKTFNVSLKTEFDPTIGTINIVPQDIGRVMLNLINNAFYVVNEKKKESGAEYEPTVWVNTKKSRDKVLVSVKDNGNGIPTKVLDKIFQPFFTTKPAGQGTGLGLSLSYDIVKAHGGELKVETIEGNGSEFIIQIPVT